MTILLGSVGNTAGGIVVEDFVAPFLGQSATCQNPAGCTATWTMQQTGTCTDCPQWFDPVQTPQRTWHFRWSLSGCTQNQGVPINTWTLFSLSSYSWSESCSNPQINSCSGTMDVSFDGGSTIAGTFTFGCFCDASP